MKAKHELNQLEKLIFNAGEMEFVKHENKLDKTVLGLLIIKEIDFESTFKSNEKMLALNNLNNLENLVWDENSFKDLQFAYSVEPNLFCESTIL